MKIDPKNGIPYELDHISFKQEDSLPYALAQHSGPWHLREAVQNSNYVTNDMEAADVIYVYDHCYYMRWLAQVRTPPSQEPVLRDVFSASAHSAACKLVCRIVVLDASSSYFGEAFHKNAFLPIPSTVFWNDTARHGQWS